MNIQAEEIMRLHVNIEKELEVGEHPEGFLRVIPITGGTFTGKMFNGKILPGGADWNTQNKTGLYTCSCKILYKRKRWNYYFRG